MKFSTSHGKGKFFDQFEAGGKKYQFELIHEVGEIMTACQDEEKMLANMMEYLGYTEAQGKAKKQEWLVAYKSRLPSYIKGGRAYLSIRDEEGKLVAVAAIDIAETRAVPPKGDSMAATPTASKASQETKSAAAATDSSAEEKPAPEEIIVTLNSLIVDESVRGRGFGGLLICKIASVVAKNDKEQNHNRNINIHTPLSGYSVAKGNVEAYRKIFEKLGFTTKNMVVDEELNPPVESSIYKGELANKVHVFDLNCGKALEILEKTSAIQSAVETSLRNIKSKTPEPKTQKSEAKKMTAATLIADEKSILE